MTAPLADLTRFPEAPGVYLFHDADGAVLYVGKAANLRARLANYRNEPDPRKAVMVEKASDITFVLTRTEKEAFVLESSLIKRHKPRYNVRLTDDKRYPYLELTHHKWPRVRISRDLKGKGRFFGPFPDAGAARRTLQVLREVFKIRDCKELIDGGCLNYQMDLCLAPCIMATSERVAKAPRSSLALLAATPPADEAEMQERVTAAYARAVKEATAFLGGDAARLTRALQDEMDTRAAALEFEAAAGLRDRLGAVTQTLERQAVFSHGQEDRDAFVVVADGPLAVGVVTLQRGGDVVGQEHYFFRHPASAAPGDLIAEFVPRYYEHLPAVPREILVGDMPPDAAGLEAMLAEQRGGPVHITAPQRGDKRRLIDLAERNARYKLDQEVLRRGESGDAAGLADLEHALGLSAPPRVIECFDVSHLHGTDVVASMVTLVDGRPARDRYRRFKVRVDKNDDFAAMEEVVTRRYTKVVKEGATRPDLVLIDGGAGQLAAARRALAAAGLPDQAVAGLAKKEEEVYLPGRLRTVRLPRDGAALLVLIRARDEAHRFAVTYQRRLREKSFKQSFLDDVPGVGAARKRALLAAFGSPDKVARASVEELARVPGVGAAVAARIHAHFNPGTRS